VSVCPTASLYRMYLGKFEDENIHLDKEFSAFINSRPSFVLCNLCSCPVMELMCFGLWYLCVMAVLKLSWPAYFRRIEVHINRASSKENTGREQSFWKLFVSKPLIATSVFLEPDTSVCFPWYREVSNCTSNGLFRSSGYRYWSIWLRTWRGCGLTAELSCNF
jgi:hypothetical protein